MPNAPYNLEIRCSTCGQPFLAKDANELTRKNAVLSSELIGYDDTLANLHATNSQLQKALRDKEILTKAVAFFHNEISPLIDQKISQAVSECRTIIFDKVKETYKDLR
jgi:hypothetical protein